MPGPLLPLKKGARVAASHELDFEIDDPSAMAAYNDYNEYQEHQGTRASLPPPPQGKLREIALEKFIGQSSNGGAQNGRQPGRMLPIMTENAMLPGPSDQSLMINATTPMDDRHYQLFASQELARLRSEGLIPASSPVGKGKGPAKGGSSSGSRPSRTEDEYSVEAADMVYSRSTMGGASYSREERELVNVLDALKSLSLDGAHTGVDDKALFRSVEAGLESRNEDDRAAMVKGITSHALHLRSSLTKKTKTPTHRSLATIVACLSVLSTLINGNGKAASLELCYNSVQGIRLLVKCFEGLPNDAPADSVQAALFNVVPALLKRVGAKKTPKELKRVICKTLLTIARSTKIDGLAVVVPYLGTGKFSAVTRLFVLKLLTKEFGLDGKTKNTLSCPLCVSTGLEVLAGGQQHNNKVGEKETRAAISLIVAVSLAEGGGVERVEKYFKIKKVEEKVVGVLRGRMEEGRVKKVEHEKRRKRRKEELRELERFDVDKKGAGVGGMIGKTMTGGDFMKQSTYLKWEEGGDDLQSEDEDEVGYDSDAGEGKENAAGEEGEGGGKGEKLESLAVPLSEKIAMGAKSLFGLKLLQSTDVLLEQMMEEIVGAEGAGENGGLDELDAVMGELFGDEGE